MSLRLTTAGESHGPGLTCILEGMPAGLALDRDSDQPRSRAPPARPRPGRPDEDRARPGRGHRRRPPRTDARRPDRPAGRQPRLRELGGADEPMAGGGCRSPRSTCPAPATPTSSAPRSTGSRDVRNILERASARETAARVAGGAVAKAFLHELGVQVFSHVIQITSVKAPRRNDLTPDDFENVDESPVRCLDADATKQDGRGDRPPPEGERVARRRLRGASRSGSSLGSARTSPGRNGSTVGSARRSCRSRRSRRSSIGDGAEVAGLPGLAGSRRDLLQRPERATTARPTAPAGSRAG